MSSLPELRLDGPRESWFARTGEPAPERVRDVLPPTSASPTPRPRAVGGLAVVGVLLSLALLTITGGVVSGMLTSWLLSRSAQQAEAEVAAEFAAVESPEPDPEPEPEAVAPPPEPAPKAEPAPASDGAEKRERRGLFRRKNR